MHLDVLDLRNFYYKTKLGRVAQRAIRDQVVGFWPPEETRGRTVAGFGFAVPLLRPYLGSARRVIALMPGQQGVMPWPAGQPNVSVLCEEMLWPLDTGSVDRLILMHGLDTSEHASEVLEECHRVLGPGGRVLFVVPNRSGLWARRDATPFGYGRPYSTGQLETQLLRHGFQPERHVTALFGPPSEKRFWLRSSGMLEKFGRQVFSSLAGGVFLTEASKLVQTPGGSPVKDIVRDPLRVLDAVNAPSGPKPA
ncbi:methyltransferase domain-containing protein [Aliiruegeria sabulilitoris]|uniref:methyltransferase domain-containing protein n=1 Tax=Aliiruegeria sabulilitoris TaxID=1510458 RepID=UPI0008350FE5|nr:methyltransferase domain-containing protein [Aliiruegeria sabulilitoris]NDR57209.1 class I SAM-dependent methyltransferase [Pseudoruegeria sp. M32A2M]